MNRLILSFTVDCFLFSAFSVAGAIDGPVLGYVFDPAGGLRTIQGIPGAALLSEPLDTGLAIRQAAISPRQDYVIAAAGDDLDLFLIQVAQGAASAQPLAQAERGPDLIALSPMGSSACLYYQGAKKMRVLTGLPESPAVAADYDLSALPAALTALAVSDDASVVLAAFAEDTAASIFVMAAGAEPWFLSVFGHVSAIAFQNGGQNAVIADDGENKVYFLRNVAAAVQWDVLAREGDGITAPVAVAVSKDNRGAYVANQGNGTITALDLSGGASATSSCACTPEGLFPLNGNAVFRLVDGASQPIWLFDGDAGDPRIVFVPATPSEHATGRRSRR